jgi:hypothetical protein
MTHALLTATAIGWLFAPLAQAPAIVGQPMPPAAEPAVVFVLTATEANGSPSASASAEALGGPPRYVWASSSLCSLGAGGDSAPAADSIAWRVSGTILERTADRVTAQIEWTRVGGGAAAAGMPSSPQTITLRDGERFLLDRVQLTSSPCAAEARFEAMVWSRAPGGGRGGRVGGIGAMGVARGGGGGASTSTTGVAGGRGSGRGSGRGGGGGAGAVATGSGTGTGGSGTTGSTSVGAAGGSGSGRGGRGGGAVAGTPSGGGRGAAAGTATGLTSARELYGVLTGRLNPSIPPMDAELWLVHKIPGKPDEVQQQRIPVGGRFSFSPITIADPKGDVTIDVTGTIQQNLVNGVPTPDVLGVTLTRRIRNANAAGNETFGGTTRQVPTSDQVTSLMLPGTADLPEGHTFEVRLRITKR